jgi:hypothetical protein
MAAMWEFWWNSMRDFGDVDFLPDLRAFNWRKPLRSCPG